MSRISNDVFNIYEPSVCPQTPIVPHFFVYGNNGLQTAPSMTLVNLTGAVWNGTRDLNGASIVFNPAAGAFTTIQEGIYLICAGLTIKASPNPGRRILKIAASSGQHSAQTYTSTGVDLKVSVAGTFKLSADETIQIVIHNETSGSLELSTGPDLTDKFSIIKVQWNTPAQFCFF